MNRRNQSGTPQSALPGLEGESGWALDGHVPSDEWSPSRPKSKSVFETNWTTTLPNMARRSLTSWTRPSAHILRDNNTVWTEILKSVLVQNLDATRFAKPGNTRQWPAKRIFTPKRTTSSNGHIRSGTACMLRAVRRHGRSGRVDASVLLPVPRFSPPGYGLLQRFEPPLCQAHVVGVVVLGLEPDRE